MRYNDRLHHNGKMGDLTCLSMYVVTRDIARGEARQYETRRMTMVVARPTHRQWCLRSASTGFYGTLAAAREAVVGAHLRRVPRSDTDDPVVVESWL